MTFEITYEGLFGSGVKTQMLEADNAELAKVGFLQIKAGVPESRIQQIKEVVIVPQDTDAK